MSCKIVKTCKGEIIQNTLENEDLNEFKSSKDYKEMILLYKNRIYPVFSESSEKSSTEENESNNENNNGNE